MFIKIQIPLYCLLQVCLACCSVSGQTIQYSNKTFGITMDFPWNWQLLTEREINSLRGNGLVDSEETNSDIKEVEDVNSITIISVALNKRYDPDYTIQVLSDKIIEASKDESEYDYLMNGIEYMKLRGLQVTKYTLPEQYSTSRGIPFCTSKLEVVIGGQTHYERNFVIKRPNDFLIISGSFLNVNDDHWMQEVVNSVSFDQ
ncbi:MAG: hypothetical protein ABIO46_14200 [Chitinophagales bacterium]